MPTRLFNIFDLYDIHGKAIPGVVMLTGIFTLLPKSIIPVIIDSESSISESFVSLILVLVLIILVGALLGEAVHSIAIIIENLIYWFGRRYANIRNMVFDRLNDSTIDLLKNGPKKLSESQKMKWPIHRQIGYNWFRGIVQWGRKRYLTAKYVLVGHRRVFELNLMDNLDDTKPFDVMVKPLSFYEEQFLRKALTEYKVNPDNILEVYPVLASQLERMDNTRAQKFQSSYAFCRGMWVNSFLLTLSYSSFIYAKMNSNIDLYSPIIQVIFGKSGIIALIGALLITMVVFMNGAGRYKILFVDYLLADIYVMDLENGNIIDKEQKNINQYNK